MNFIEESKSVIYIGNFSLPDGNAASLRVISNAKLFISIGINTKVISTSNNLRKRFFQVDGVKCYSILQHHSKFLRLFSKISNWQVFQLLSKISSKNNILVLYNPSFIFILATYIFSKFYKNKLVLDLTEYDDVVGLSGLWKWIKFCDTFLRMEFSWRLADGIITTSAMLTKKYNKQKCYVVELPTLQDTKNFLAPKIIEQARTRLVYSGTPFLVERKRVKERLDFVIKALSRINTESFSLDIFGPTYNDYVTMYPEHKSLLAEMSESINFHGYIPNSELRKHLRQSDFQVFFRDMTLANKAGFPTKLSESISSGVPAITTKLNGIIRYIDAPFIFACETGNESNILEYCIKLSREEKNKLKELAYKATYFILVIIKSA